MFKRLLQGSIGAREEGICFRGAAKATNSAVQLLIYATDFGDNPSSSKTD